MQMVFQDPHGSLDPSMRIGRIVAEPLRILGWSKEQVERRVAEVLDLVGLPGEYHRRLPRELSGGQRQRIGIARALGPRPQVLLLDEPVASLDVSIQGQILRLLKDIQAETDIAALVIAHDLGVVRAIADRTLVMYSGRIVEAGTTPPVFESPLHPYTAALLWSATAEERARMGRDVQTALAKEPLGAAERMHGCVFRSRCWRTIERCEHTVERAEDGSDHLAYCNVPLDPPVAERRA
jgi:oligopeptide/dipeptide ABC transporter ATP-binding protein